MSGEYNLSQTRGVNFLKPIHDYKKKYDSIFEPTKIDQLQGQFENLSKVLGTFTDSLSLNTSEYERRQGGTRSPTKKLLGSKLLAGDADNDGIQEQFEEGEVRFKEMNFRIQNIKGYEPKERQKCMKKFVADITRKVMSQGFKYFENGDLTEKKLRQFFCNNVLSNIVRYASHNKLSRKQLRVLDDHLKNKVLPFLKQRYPQNESNDANRKFQSVISPVDNFDSNSNDLVFPSGIKFELKENEDYSSEIMQFINFLLKQTRRKIKVVDENDEGKEIQKSIFKMFQEDMENIFKKVQDDIFMVHAKTKNFELYEEQKFKAEQNATFKIIGTEKNVGVPGTGNASQKKIEVQKSLQELKVEAQKQKYKQKVKSYTKYLIGKKIADNFEEFSKKEIESSNLTVKDAGIMRILTKWCQELEKCFEEVNINSKDERFRMDEGTERYIKKSEREELFIEIQEQYNKLQEFLTNVKDNIYTNQQKILKDDRWIDQLSDFCSEPQASAGYFSTISKRSYENYLVSYLNKLIHCIIKAQEGLKSRHSKKDHYKIAVNLISFKIGDLLRCKCSSREDEIIAIYNYLVYLCKEGNGDYDMVRVKNRLQEGTRDILINLKYKKRLLVEMQLSINQETSNFIKCSDKANHFIYELERSTFGPISQLCNVYSLVDPRANFFSKNFQAMNQVVNEKKIIHKCEIQNMQKTKNSFKLFFETSLPVWCSVCYNFSSSLNIPPSKHRKCTVCDYIICARCISMLKSAQTPSLKFDSLAKTGKKLKDCVKKKIQVKQFNKMNSTSFIYLVFFNFKLMFFESSKIDQGKKQQSFNLVGEAKKEKQFRELIRQWQILDVVHIITEEQFKNIQQPLNNSLITMTVKNVNKKLRKYFVFEQQQIDESILQDKKMITVETLNMKKTNLKTVSILINAFPNAKFVLIHKNNIQSLEGIQKWELIQELNLEGNKLSKIPENIKLLKNLKFLLITNNKFSEFPKQLCQLECLETLNFKENEVKVIDENISKLKNLRVLRMAKNQIHSVHPQIGKLINLTQFDFSKNKLKEIPEELKKLVNLKDLNISQNEITKIDDNFFVSLVNLKKVIMFSNKIEQIPSSLKYALKLESIDFDSNLLETVPSFIFELPLIEEILLADNKLSQIKIDKSKITKPKLKILSVNKNRLKGLPDQVFLFRDLEKLKLSQNKQFGKISQKFSGFTKLKEISISGLGLTEFPKVICQMKEIQAISFDENRVTQLPQDLGDLKNSLRELYMSDNLLKQFPQALLECNSLENLGLNRNKISIVPDFSNLRNLQKIKLQGNEIKKFEDVSGQMKFLTSIYISENSKKLLEGTKLFEKDLGGGRKRYIGTQQQAKKCNKKQ